MNNFQDTIIKEENPINTSNSHAENTAPSNVIKENADVEETKVYGSRNADKFVVRLPKGMRQTIAQVAKNYHRSMNSEIVSRLELSLRTEQWLSGNGEEEANNSETTKTELTMQEYSIIEQVRKLSPERQQSLLNIVAGLNP